MKMNKHQITQHKQASPHTLDLEQLPFQGHKQQVLFNFYTQAGFINKNENFRRKASFWRNS
jgi:hypothetical protein